MRIKAFGQVARYDKSTRPDYLFCPPVPGTPLVGVHVDHLVVAEALLRTAYLINVPHAFTPEFPGVTGKETGEPEYMDPAPPWISC